MKISFLIQYIPVWEAYLSPFINAKHTSIGSFSDVNLGVDFSTSIELSSSSDDNIIRRRFSEFTVIGFIGESSSIKIRWRFLAAVEEAKVFEMLIQKT